MNTEIIAGFAICVLSGLFTMALGWLIWKKEYYHLISGFNAATYKGDLKILGKLVGNLALVIGGLTIILPFSLEFIGNWTGIAYGVLTIGGCLYVVIKSTRLSRGK